METRTAEVRQKSTLAENLRSVSSKLSLSRSRASWGAKSLSTVNTTVFSAPKDLIRAVSSSAATTKKTLGDASSHVGILGVNLGFDEEQDEQEEQQHALAGLWHAGYCGGLASAGVPQQLWDTRNENFLNLVVCRAYVKLIHIDDATGCFKCRFTCNWSFRMLQQSRTEPRIRIPGIRMTTVSCVTEESRVWREMLLDTQDSAFFNGCSIFSFTGFQTMQVKDFPFDRQILDLGSLDFVWRREKDSDTFEEEMNITKLTITCETVMPRWKAWRCWMRPLNEKAYEGAELEGGSDASYLSGDQPSTAKQEAPRFATRFLVRLRIERRPHFFIRHVFLLTWLVTLGSLLALAMPSRHVGKASELSALSLLTLIGFKISIGERLPHVSYLTFADKYLMWQVVIVCVTGLWVIIQYRVHWEAVTWCLLGFGAAFSTANFLVASRSRPLNWTKVLEQWRQAHRDGCCASDRGEVHARVIGLSSHEIESEDLRYGRYSKIVESAPREPVIEI